MKYDRLFAAQEREIERFIKRGKKLGEKRNRDQYFDPKFNPKFDPKEEVPPTLAALRAHRRNDKFKFDGIDSYLFFDPPSSHKPVHSTHIVQLNNKRYYLHGKKVVAIVEKRGENNHLLRRFDSSCKLIEVVRFGDISPNSEDPVGYKVNGAACSLPMTELLATESVRRDDLRMILNPPSDAEELAEWKKDLSSSCEQYGGRISTNKGTGRESKPTGEASEK